MADKKSRRRKREDSPEKPTKEEYAIAKFLRFSVPTKQAKLHGMEVTAFIASEAVDKLLDSKWGRNSENILFGNRHSCVDYCHRLLEKGMFHRALKVERKKDKDKRRKKKDADEANEEEEIKDEKKTKKERKAKKGKDKDKTEKEEDGSKVVEAKEGEAEETPRGSPKAEKKDEEKKKKKDRKLKLSMHDHQMFKDGDEVYVWIYDPVPLKTFIIGLLLVLGAIGVCLFPLWPPEVRQGVYYLSLAAAGFVGVILSLCVVRLVLFCVVWVGTMGKHHFWFLPNLTEDVGFFDSFKPLYKHEVADDKDKSKDKKIDKKLDGKENDSKKVQKEDENRRDDEGKEEGGNMESDDDEEEESGSGGEEAGYEMVDADELQGEEEGEEEEPKKTK